MSTQPFKIADLFCTAEERTIWEGQEHVWGLYGFTAHRSTTHYPYWFCDEGGEYTYYAITDDFGKLVRVSLPEN